MQVALALPVPFALLLLTAHSPESAMEHPFAREIGPELYAACAQNDVIAISNLTTTTSPSTWSGILAIAAAEGASEVATYCIQKGARVDDNVLRKVICNDRSEAVYHQFVESGLVSVDYYIERWGTMLGISAAVGRKSRVEYLLRKGANPNCLVDSHGHKTALACAAGFSNEEVLGLLLDNGARLNGSGALVFAAQKNRIANVRFLLARGADVDETGIENPADRRSLNSLGTPLHKAVEAGNGEVVEALLGAGANVRLRDAKGRTAVDIDNARETRLLPPESQLVPDLFQPARQNGNGFRTT